MKKLIIVERADCVCPASERVVVLCVRVWLLVSEICDRINTTALLKSSHQRWLLKRSHGHNHAVVLVSYYR